MNFQNLQLNPDQVFRRQTFKLHAIHKYIIKLLILTVIGVFPTCVISSSEEIMGAVDIEPNIENGKKIYPLCASCHMQDGWGKADGSFPVIAGQHRKVLIKQLADIRGKNRDNPTMYPFSDPAEIGGIQGVSDVTAYIASMEKDRHPGTGSGKNLARAEEIYQKQCMQCHGAEGQGNNDAFFPSLNGQHYAYLLRQLKWVRDGYRKNADPAMVAIVKTLSEEELDAVADYLSRL